MRTAVQETDPFGGVAGGRAVLAQMPRLVGVYRSCAHTVLIFRSWRKKGKSRWLWTAFGVASLANDLLIARSLKRTGQPNWRWRTLIDSAEAAIWTQATAPDPTSSRCTVLGSVPTSLDVAYNVGLSDRFYFRDVQALLPSALVICSQSLARRHRGWKPLWGQVGWPLLGVAAGFGLGRNRRAVRRRARESWRDHAGPRVEAAWWRGQHDVTMSESDPRSPHNLKKDLLVMEAQGSLTARAARDRLASRKSELVDLTQPFGAYLGEVIRGLVIVPTDAWSIRLTPTQVSAMRLELARHAPSLFVKLNGDAHPLVVVDEIEARRPGGRIRLEWGTAAFSLPASAPPVRWTGDPAPLTFLLGAIWKMTILPAFHTPKSIVYPLAAFDVVAASAYRKAAPEGSDIVRPVHAAIVSNVLFAAAIAGWCRHRFLDAGSGEHGYPGLEGATSLAIISARYWEELPPSTRRATVAALAAIAGVSAWTGPRPRSWLTLIEDVLSATLPLTAASDVATKFTEDAAQAWDQYAERAIVLIDDAYETGARLECELLADLIGEAEHALEEIASAVNEPDVNTIRKNLKEAREWLKERLASLS